MATFDVEGLLTRFKVWYTAALCVVRMHDGGSS